MPANPGSVWVVLPPVVSGGDPAEVGCDEEHAWRLLAWTEQCDDWRVMRDRLVPLGWRCIEFVPVTELAAAEERGRLEGMEYARNLCEKRDGECPPQLDAAILAAKPGRKGGWGVRRTIKLGKPQEVHAVEDWGLASIGMTRREHVWHRLAKMATHALHDLRQQNPAPPRKVTITVELAELERS